MRLSRWKLLVAIIILISLAGKLYIVYYTDGLWWDEAVYLGLGRNLFDNHYTLEPGVPLESFRPPMLPVITSSFYWSPLLARSLVAVMSLVAVLAVYFLGKELFGEKEGLIAALFTGTSYLFVFYSSKLMTEPLFIILFSLSLILFSRWSKSGEGRDILACGMLTGAAFMTRYLAYVLILAYLAYLLHPIIRKEKPDLKATGGFLLGIIASLLPWFLVGYIYYGNPVGGFITNFNIWSFSFSQTLLEGLQMLGSSFGYIWIFLAFGLYTIYRVERKRTGPVWTMLIVIVISILFFLGSSHKEARYLLSFFPAYVIIAAMGARRALRKGTLVKAAVVVAIAAVSIATMFLAFQYAWADRHSGAPLYQASLFLANSTAPGDSILTQSYPYVYLAGRKAVPYCDNYVVNDAWEACQAQIIARTWDPSQVEPLLEKHNITYILSYKFELMNTRKAISYFDRYFEKVKAWEYWSDPDAVVVYRVANQNATVSSS